MSNGFLSVRNSVPVPSHDKTHAATVCTARSPHFSVGIVDVEFVAEDIERRVVVADAPARCNALRIRSAPSAACHWDHGGTWKGSITSPRSARFLFRSPAEKCWPFGFSEVYPGNSPSNDHMLHATRDEIFDMHYPQVCPSSNTRVSDPEQTKIKQTLNKQMKQNK
jgi:hypothetical protein